MILLKAVLWDMDGTLIDSEPVWHRGEAEIARANGGVWDEDSAWRNAGKPVECVAEEMVERGTRLGADEIVEQLVSYVFEDECRQMPWTPGVLQVLQSLACAGVPSVLVTASPKQMAENLTAQAPEGAFVGYVSGSDDLPKKPDPAPYLAAGRLLGIADGDSAAMARCIAIEDSISGLRSAAASGATTLAQTAFNLSDNSSGPQFANIDGYDGITVGKLEEFVQQRVAKR